ncbi:MAG: fasciclin domain-containing protein [Cyanobacteria bacterium P01_H01_bin.21]
MPLQVSVGQQVTVNSATVRTADITANNGVIHAIDTVLIPQR